MESDIFFQTISKINSLLFLVLLVMGLGLASYIIVDISSWNNKGALQVNEDPKDLTSEKVELVLESLVEIEGSSSQYVQLRSKAEGGKFSSRYGGEIRNVLFIHEDKNSTSWLLKDHKNIIIRHDKLKGGDTKTSKVLAHLYQVVDKDTDGDEMLTRDDQVTLSLSKPDGSDYREIIKGVTSIVDTNVKLDESSLSVLAQLNGEVYLYSISLSDFEILKKIKVLDVGGW